MKPTVTLRKRSWAETQARNTYNDHCSRSTTVEEAIHQAVCEALEKAARVCEEETYPKDRGEYPAKMIRALMRADEDDPLVEWMTSGDAIVAFTLMLGCPLCEGAKPCTKHERVASNLSAQGYRNLLLWLDKIRAVGLEKK